MNLFTDIQMYMFETKSPLCAGEDDDEEEEKDGDDDNKISKNISRKNRLGVSTCCVRYLRTGLTVSMLLTVQLSMSNTMQ